MAITPARKGTTRTYWAVCDVTAFGGTADISHRRDNTGDAMLAGATPVQSVEASVICPMWLPLKSTSLPLATLLRVATLPFRRGGNYRERADARSAFGRKPEDIRSVRWLRNWNPGCSAV